jgi:membrane-bound lytic murein transglycosylase B
MKRGGKEGFLGLFLLTSLVSSFVYIPRAHADDEVSGLQGELSDIEKKIAEDQAAIKALAGEAKTLTNRIALLRKQKALLAHQMEATQEGLDDVTTRLNDTEVAIKENETRQEVLQVQISGLINEIRKADDRSPLYAFLTSANLFEALDTMQVYTQLTGGLHTEVDTLQKNAQLLKTQKDDLLIAEEEARSLAEIHKLQETALEENTSAQTLLLAETKEEEAAGQSILSDHKAAAAAIRQRLYALLGTGSQSVTFGQAVKTADWVSQVTGIEPAFLLSVLSQESALGANVGTCNRVGDPPSKNWKVVMKPERDQEPFLAITDALGKSPEGTPVSCPMHDKAGNQIGWGGAMGPAQFIPSTWIGYAGKVTAITGVPSNPWDIRDAFIAAALKLTADGADGTDDGNWRAAMRYFSGSTDTRFRFYGDQVLSRAKQYEADIEELSQE